MRICNPRTVAKRKWIKKVALERGCSYAVAAQIGDDGIKLLGDSIDSLGDRNVEA